MSTLIDVEAVDGGASTFAFFDLDRTNSAMDTGLERDNLQVEVRSSSTGATKGRVYITFPPRPDVTLDPGDSGVVVNLYGGQFSSDAFVLAADVFGITMNFAVSGGQIGGGWDYGFAPRNTGLVDFATIQDAVANGFDLVLRVADEVSTGVWGSWEHVNITLIGIEPAPTPPPPAARSTPSLRMLQRGGQGGMSGIPRMVGNPVRGLRQGPGSVY